MKILFTYIIKTNIGDKIIKPKKNMTLITLTTKLILQYFFLQLLRILTLI